MKKRSLVSYDVMPSRKEERSSKAKVAFSLAEVLIVIGIIGIVAAITIPTLMATVEERITNNRKAAFEKKLSTSMDLLNVENGVGPYYHASSQDTVTTSFLKQLSKHMKISTICDGSESNPLSNCLRYKDDEGVLVSDGSKLTLDTFVTGASMGLDANNYPDVGGMTLADGTAMILSWNEKCPTSDAYSMTYSGGDWKNPSSVSNTTNCIKGFYDLNGPAKPNEFGRDVFGFGVDLNGNNVGFKCKEFDLGGTKICIDNHLFTPTPIDCRPTSSEYAGAKYCTGSNKPSNYEQDYWAGARKACMDKGAHLPNQSQGALITSNINLVFGAGGYAVFWRDVENGNGSGAINSDNVYDPKSLYRIKGLCVK